MKECLRQATAGGEGWCIGVSYKLFPFLWAGLNAWCHDGFREGGFHVFFFCRISTRSYMRRFLLLTMILLFFSRKGYAESFYSPSPFLDYYSFHGLPRMLNAVGFSSSFSKHTCYLHILLISLSGPNYTPSLRFTIPSSLDFA